MTVYIQQNFEFFKYLSIFWDFWVHIWSSEHGTRKIFAQLCEKNLLGERVSKICLNQSDCFYVPDFNLLSSLGAMGDHVTFWFMTNLAEFQQ